MKMPLRPWLDVLLLLVAGTAIAAAPPRLVWETPGFSDPESAAYDQAREVLYVSNMNREGADGGFISRLGLDGTLLEKDWVTGLREPKGLDLYGNTLYVADQDALVEIDIPTGTVRLRYPVTAAGFLNDVAVAADGSVYLSDMMRDTIHLLRDGRLEPWLEASGLESPNGLLVEADRLLVGAWGVRSEGFQTPTPGHLKIVSLPGQRIQSLGDGTPQGNLDGIEPAPEGGYYVTDWMAGALLYVDALGKATQLLDLEQGSADLEYLPGPGLVIIPMMLNGTVRAYRTGNPADDS